MEIVILILGVLILLFVLYDIYFTALGLSGGGRLSLVVGNTLWSLLVKSKPGRKDSFLSITGILILMTILSIWILTTWFSVFLIFSSSKYSVIDSITGKPADYVQRFYFSGYILSTLGNGEYRPYGSFSKFMTAFGGFTGFLIISFSATYLISVRNAVTLKVQIATYIASMGKDVKDILEMGWNGENFNSLAPHFNYLLPLIIEHNVNHHAFPIIHYFHFSKRNMSFVINFAKLMEVVFILNQLPDKYFNQTLKPLVFSFENYFETVELLLPSSIKAPEESLASLEKDVARNFNLDEFFNEIEKSPKLKNERKCMAGLLSEQGLLWKNIYLID